MKHILFSIFLLFSVNLFGQVPFATYQSSYVGKTYKASVSFPDSSNYMVFMEMFSLDKLSPEGGMLMDWIEHLLFTRQLSEAKNKYVEWVKVAKQNNVQSLEKPIDLDCYTKSYFYFGGEWRFQFIVKLSFTYKILDGKHLLIVKTGKLVDDKNEFITHNGFAMIFTDVNEINKFLNDLSVKKVEEFRKQQSLFKD